MSQRRSASGKIRWRAVIVPVVLAAWLLRAFVPLGFMPAKAEDGWTTLVICTGDGLQSITLDADGEPVDAASPVDPASPIEPAPGKQQDGPCLQSASAKFAAGAVTISALPSQRWRQTVRLPVAEQSFIATFLPGTLRSRAPPVQS